MPISIEEFEERFFYHIPDYKELLQGCAAYIEQEKRDTIYKIAHQLILEAQWQPDKLAEGLGVLLLAWNAAFYTKYGSFDFDLLEHCIEKHLLTLRKYEQRNIFSYTQNDDLIIQELFTDFLEALKSVKKTGRTPVGVAKALHLLSPEFFSLWDDNIAKEYKVLWVTSDKSPQLYVKFQAITLEIARGIVESYKNQYNVTDEVAMQEICGKWYRHITNVVYKPLTQSQIQKKSLVKLIDEYNYAKYRLKLDLDKYKTVINSKIID